MHLGFEWDEKKALENVRKHRVRFEDAKTIFNDPMLLTFHDPDHSLEEQRSISIGLTARYALLLVVHTERESNIRIISARRATAKEQRTYETF